MSELKGSFTYGGVDTVEVTVDFEGDTKEVLAAEFILHLAQDSKDDADTFKGEGMDRLFGSIAYDRDPGNACLETVLAAKGDRLGYTVKATVNGNEMHEHGVTGGETNISWRTRLGPRPVVTPPDTGDRTPVTHEMTLESGIAASGESTPSGQPADYTPVAQ